MIYKFKSTAAADVIMLAANGDRFLRLVGKQPAVRGIIEASHLPAAIAALEAAIAQDERPHAGPHGDAAGPAPANADADTDTDTDTEAEADGAPRVRLRQRMWPMLEMMKRAVAERADIVWGV